MLKTIKSWFNPTVIVEKGSTNFLREEFIKCKSLLEAKKKAYKELSSYKGGLGLMNEYLDFKTESKDVIGYKTIPKFRKYENGDNILSVKIFIFKY